MQKYILLTRSHEVMESDLEGGNRDFHGKRTLFGRDRKVFGVECLDTRSLAYKISI